MDYLNLAEFSRLCSQFEAESMGRIIQEGQAGEGVEARLEGEEEGLLEVAAKLNQREALKLSYSRAKKEAAGPERWMFGEFKIFLAVALLRGRLVAKSFAQFDHSDAVFIQGIFQRKSLPFIKYEIAAILEARGKTRRDWSTREQELMASIITQLTGEVEWRSVAVQLFSESDCAFFRGQKDCRERWRNYMDPKVSRCEWSEEEDAKLMQLVEAHGFRWAHIARKFQGTRTEHMVKNRYNSFLKVWRNKTDRPRRTRREKADSHQEHRETESLSQEASEQEQRPEPQPAALELEEPQQEQKMEREELLCSQFIEQRLLQNSNIYDKFLKRTNDEEELSMDPGQGLSWHCGERKGFEAVFSMEPEVQRTAMSELTAALGCSHFEAMLGGYEGMLVFEPDSEKAFDWLA